MAFRLMRILRLYEREEEQRMLEYQSALQCKDEWVRVVTHWERALAQATPGAIFPGEQLQQIWVYRCSVIARLASSRESLQNAEEAVLAAREKLLAARQQRKTMQSLQDKYNARVHAELFRREQQAIDETGLRNYLIAQVQDPSA